MCEILTSFLKVYQLSEKDYTIQQGVAWFNEQHYNEKYTNFGNGWCTGRQALIEYEGRLKCSKE